MSHIKAALKDIFSSDLEVKILDDQQLSAYHGVAPDRPGSLLESDAFTFGTYVVGPQNKMAYAAARAVAEKPAEHYNPLFIYGDSGLGKTHLLYAIAHQVRSRQPDARIVYIKGDDFGREKMRSSGRNTVRPPCCWWTISNSSPEKNRPRRSFSIPSTPCMNPGGRSF